MLRDPYKHRQDQAAVEQLIRPDLVVLDELDYLPFAKSGSRLMFRLIGTVTSKPRC